MAQVMWSVIRCYFVRNMCQPDGCSHLSEEGGGGGGGGRGCYGLFKVEYLHFPPPPPPPPVSFSSSSSCLLLLLLLLLLWSSGYKQEVQLPANFTCEKCIIQLLRQAREWRAPGGYIFFSCADVSIVDGNGQF